MQDDCNFVLLVETNVVEPVLNRLQKKASE